MSFLMGVDDMCNTGLVLGLGLSSSAATEPAPKTEPHKPVKWTVAEPNLTLALSGESYIIGVRNKAEAAGNKVAAACEDCSVGRTESNNNGRQASPHSTVSSFSSPRPVKRERDLSSEEVEAERVQSKVAGDEDDVDGLSARKKLRLTKEQSALLEESFKQHSTLNPKQKQALARQLNLRPRQVEVWFQNRRARTKLKQTEVDCEFLKKCCETLTDENRRLQKELQELKGLKLGQPLYMHMPAATLTMCPSCERIGSGGVGDGGGSSKSPFSMAPKAHLYSPFSNPSAAC